MTINPILIRFMRSRLRLKGALFWYVLVFTICAFSVTMTYVTETQRMGKSPMEAARATVMGLVIIQGIVLLLLGTGSVASGITRDKVEDVLDYQRLTPMTPLGNLWGFLLGLPIREYVLFAITMPFALVALIVGEIPLLPWLIFYLIFFLSALLYHATGMVAGLISKGWRFSGKLAQGLVFVLYFILPQFSHLGFVSFEFLTVRPVFANQLFPILYPGQTGDLSALSALEGKRVPFFEFSISPTLFSVLLQASLLVLLLAMGRRKWIQRDAPSLSKIMALVVFFVVLVLSLGNLWPNLTGAAAAMGIFAEQQGIQPEVFHLIFPMTFCLLMMMVALLLSQVIGTQSGRYRRGCIRAERWKWKSIPLTRDESSSLWIISLFVTGAAIALFTIYHQVSIHYPIREKDLLNPAYQFFLPLGLALLLVQFIALREWLGEKRIFLYQLLYWLGPLLVAMIFGAASNRFGDTSLWIAGLSPLSLIPYGGLSIAGPALTAEIPVHIFTGRNFAFIFQAFLTCGLVFLQQRSFSKIRNAFRNTPENSGFNL